MKVQVKITPDVLVELEADSHTEIFKELSSAQELLSNTCCGACGEKDIKYVVREVGKFEYFELHCSKCFARLPFGQSGGKKGTLYPKRRWNSLSDKSEDGAKSEQERRISEKAYADSHGGFLPNGGWFKFKKEKE